MRKAGIALCAVMLASGIAAAQGDAPKAYLDLSGFYAFNGYSQQNFFLGDGRTGGVSNDDRYSIQMLRLLMSVGYGDSIKAVVRADLAQGIWGIDNDQRTPERGGFTNLFNNKDTNFSVHIDWAYVDYTNADWGFNAKLGRQKYKLGHMLVLDQDNDGIILSKTLGAANLSFGWSKMSEGQDSLSDLGAPPEGGKDYRDADVYYLNLATKAGGWNLSPYVAYYKDSGWRDDTAYIPQGFQYFNARFRPQITQATVLGLSFDTKIGPVSLKGEADYLTGSDDIENTDSGPKELLDVNNGDLSGYNLYLDAKVNVGPGTLGAVLGLGSGDDDVMSGEGNINKIRTNGFFYITEVWEDSIMPDELGITPQGLGSPASRGYRELENTQLLQLNYVWDISQTVSLFAAGTVLRATEPIQEWNDANGDGAISPDEMGPGSSDDLGSELDARLIWKISQGFAWIFRGGIFFTGDGAGYLINGTNAYTEDAYELRTTIRFSFGGLRLGG